MGFQNQQDQGGLSQQGIDDANLQAQIKALQDQIGGPSVIGTTGPPEPCVPNFVLGYQTVKKNRLRAQFCVNVQPGTDRIKASICRTDSRSNAAEFDLNRIASAYTLDDSQKTSGHVEYLYEPSLDYNAQYDLVRLVSIDPDGIRQQLPAADPVFNSPPILQFITPPPFGATSAPSLGNIIENSLDLTTKAFDAFVVVQIIAPASATNGIAGTVATTLNSTTVVGTGTSFTTAFAVGNSITVSGESHIVTNITDNTHLTVDFPYKQNTSGAAATRGILQTWDQVNAIRVIPKFRLSTDPDGRALTKSYYFTDTSDGGLTSVLIRVEGFIAARKYRWMTNAIVSESGRVAINPISPVEFIAGGFTPDTPGIPELTAPTWQYDESDSGEGFKLTKFRITQPNPCVALDNVEIQRRVLGQGTISYTSGNTTITGVGTQFLSEVFVGNTLNVGTYLTSGFQRLTVASVTNDTSLVVEVAPNATASTQPYKIGRILDEHNVRRQKYHPNGGGQIKFVLGDLKVKKLTNQDFCVVWTSQLGNGREDIDNFTTGDTGGGTATPGPLTFPAIASNTVDGDPDKNLARVTFTEAPATGTFASQNITATALVFLKLNDAGTPFGSFITEGKTLTTAEGPTTVTFHEVFLRMGQRYRLVAVEAINGDKKTESTGVLDFTAGGIRTVDPTDTFTVPAPTFVSQPAPDGNKLATFTIRVAQPGSGVDIVWLKKLIVEVSYQGSGGPWKLIEGSPTGLKAEDTLYTTVTSFKDFAYTCKRKPGTTLDVRATVTAVGGKQSATTLATQLAANVDDLPQDLAGAGPVQNLTLVWSKKKGYKATWQRPVTNFQSIRFYKVAFSDNGGTNWMNPVTGQLAANEAAATIQVPDTSYATLLLFSQLASQFQTSARVKVTPVNVVNSVETDGTATTSAAVSPTGDDPLGTDIAAPTGLGTPTLDWNASSKLEIGNLTVSTNINTLKEKYIVLQDAFGHFYDFPNNALAGSEAAARLKVGLTDRYVAARSKLKHIRKAFDAVVSPPYNLFCYFYAENDFGLSLASTTSAAIPITSKQDFLSGTVNGVDRDAVNVVDIGVTLTGYQNLGLNGDFLYDSGVANELNQWSRGTIGGTTNVITNASADASWDQANHCISWTANTDIFQNLKKRLIRQDFYSVTFLVRSVGGTFGSGTVNVNIVNADNTIATDAGGGFNASLLTLGYQLFGVTVRTDSVSDFSANKFLRISVAGLTLGGGNPTIQFDKVMLVRGEQGVSFVPRAQQYEGAATNPGNAENHSVTPTGQSFQDQARPSGAIQGGWVTSGTGGRIVADTL